MKIIPIAGFTEPFSSISHLLAAFIFFVAGLVLILRHKRKGLGTFSMSIFIFSSVTLLSLSGTYHLLDNGSTGREVLRRLDHAGIFLLIAGTFTPIHINLFRGLSRWGILVFVWMLAITGITLKSIFFNEIPFFSLLEYELKRFFATAVSTYPLRLSETRKV